MDIFEAARTNNVTALNDLLKEGQINKKDTRGSTPLILATYYNNTAAVSALLKAGADTEIQDGMGNTALMGVCFKGYTQVAQLLLENGASVHTENGNGATALTFAATFGHNDIITLLLHHGASPLKKDRFGKNPIDYALLQENATGYETMVAAAKR
ncbi:ankyrin repeat domain-containing protein [Chitinophaga filiformis]|uniref:ankyrin repeat domain-containing protein n=1 Tax=Chitinophaga filiformis TaxID=104663 RepID=UPI001F29DF3E|nr:ankyrin repeat domain-containing protein [Chitinophaga filiformis]MCF6402882.1 ankyrin repeat domain-containing protein [Chitinophaga filiformis]MCF6403200.1 ankyrin repeat domain-containing protein [Chitinophaga filiformis]